MSTGADLIRLERIRQRETEGFTATRDAQYVHGELLTAAKGYLIAGQVVQHPEHFGELHHSESGTELVPPAVLAGEPPAEWPWHRTWWKPDLEDPVQNLVKAGALIAAEIDRIQHARQAGGRTDG